MKSSLFTSIKHLLGFCFRTTKAVPVACHSSDITSIHMTEAGSERLKRLKRDSNRRVGPSLRAANFLRILGKFAGSNLEAWAESFKAARHVIQVNLKSMER